MSVLTKLFGTKEKEAVTAPAPDAARCPHTTLVPQWDRVTDMGDEAKATAWTCQGCQQTFTGEEGRSLRRTEAARVRQLQHDLPS